MSQSDLKSWLSLTARTNDTHPHPAAVLQHPEQTCLKRSMMEGKRPLEDTSSCYDSALSNAASPQHYSPRLPTPEASRSSDSSHDSQASYSRASKRGPAVSDLLSFRPTLPDIDPLRSTLPKPFDMGNSRDGPRSPPYRSIDDQKPLLPPLRMVSATYTFFSTLLTYQVISNAMNSPPETPRTDGASLQPSPREPAVHTASFKPLAFYPNKKPRTEVRDWHDSTAPDSRPSSRHVSRRFSDASAKYLCGRCPQHRYEGSCCSQSEGSVYYTSRPGSSGFQLPHPSDLARSPDDRVSPTSDNAYPIRQGQALPALPTRPFFSSINDGRDYWASPSCASERDPCERHSYEQVRSDHRRDSMSFQHSNCRDVCSSKSAPFFVQPHFDYSQGKTRKRSNLPKQSTEIMKTWFDNVCHSIHAS